MCVYMAHCDKCLLFQAPVLLTHVEGMRYAPSLTMVESFVPARVIFQQGTHLSDVMVNVHI